MRARIMRTPSCTSLSSAEGIPSRRSFPGVFFGICTLRTGCGLYRRSRMSATRLAALSGEYPSMVVVVVPRVRAPLFPWMLRYACIHKSGWFISRRRSLTLLPLRATFEIALNLSPVRADSIRMSLQLIAKASRTVPLPRSMGLSSVLPQLIPWLIQLLLAAQPITGKRGVLWRLRCHTGVRTQAQHQLRQSCISA
jgi:hypothetical protein